MIEDVGLSELAISLLNYVNTDEVSAHISHKRIMINETVSQFSNPVNITIDSISRDIAEYLKVNYIANNLSDEDVLNHVRRIDFNNSEAILFLSRLIYPSYYFDIYDQIIQDKASEEKLENIIKNNVPYETLLKKVYIELKNKYRLPEIEWLISLS